MFPKNREARIEYKRAYRRKKGLIPKRKHDAHVKEWNHEQIRLRRLHDAHVKEWRRDDARIARWRTCYDLAYLLNLRLRVAIRKAMKGDKAGRSWESFVGYTLHDLLTHLRRMLPKGYAMTDFHNGKLHIDHIVPKSHFDLTTPGGVREAWALPNLRPLPAWQNASKGSKRVFLL